MSSDQADDFAERYYEGVFVPVKADVMHELRTAHAATHGRAWTAGLSAWFVALGPEDQAQVAKVVHLAADAACFHTLTALDGAGSLYDGDTGPRLIASDGTDLSETPLHATFRALVDESDPSLWRFLPPSTGTPD